MTKTRNFKEFLSDVTRKPLMLFPLVGLAHILWLIWIVWGDRHIPISDIEWLQALWLLGYTVFWIGACDYRRWGALGYMALTLLNACLFLFIRSNTLRELYMSPLFLLDDLFSFFLLFFYKRFR